MNAFLDKLKDLFSKSFIVSSFLPVLVVVAVNAALLYATSERFRDFVSRQEPSGSLAGVLQAGSLLFAVAVLATLVSPSTTFFREVLEGKHWMSIFNAVRTPLVEHQFALRKASKTRIRYLQYMANQLDTVEWLQDLRDAAEVGRKVGAKGYTPHKTLIAFDEATAASKADEVVEFRKLDNAKAEVAERLKLADEDSFPELQLLHTDFINLLEYAEARIDEEVVGCVNEQQRKWSATAVAPTELGNLANATAAYGLKRYGFSMEIGWSRLQKVIQKDTAQVGILQDIKAGLDAVVTLLALIAVTTIAWSLYLVTQLSLVLFLVVTFGGMVSCVLLYRTAVASYVAFADLLRSSVDLYRFDLLTALHLPLPGGPTEEKTTWKRLRDQAEFGETAELRYEHAKGAVK